MKFAVHATDGAARAGTLELAHGKVETPVFMPVGTYGAVKAVSPAELAENGTRIVLGNTFHLWLRPGLETIAAHRGGGPPFLPGELYLPRTATPTTPTSCA